MAGSKPCYAVAYECSSELLGLQPMGLTCDWLLVFVWTCLAWLSARPRPAYLCLGLAADMMHAVKILLHSLTLARRVQLTGLTCDWLLIFVWARLVVLSSTPRPAYLWLGLAGATMHMVEILPLLSLLVGLLPSPWLPGELLFSLLYQCLPSQQADCSGSGALSCKQSRSCPCCLC